MTKRVRWRNYAQTGDSPVRMGAMYCGVRPGKEKNMGGGTSGSPPGFLDRKRGENPG